MKHFTLLLPSLAPYVLLLISWWRIEIDKLLLCILHAFLGISRGLLPSLLVGTVDVLASNSCEVRLQEIIHSHIRWWLQGFVRCWGWPWRCSLVPEIKSLVRNYSLMVICGLISWMINRIYLRRRSLWKYFLLLVSGVHESLLFLKLLL